jgi:hypothetical protein
MRVRLLCLALIFVAGFVSAADESGKIADAVWVVLITDVTDDDGSAREYKGELSAADFADLESGETGKRFVHLKHYFWIDDDGKVQTPASDSDGVIDDVRVRADTVIAIHRLQAEYIEQVVLPQLALPKNKDSEPEHF